MERHHHKGTEETDCCLIEGPNFKIGAKRIMPFEVGSHELLLSGVWRRLRRRKRIALLYILPLLLPSFLAFCLRLQTEALSARLKRRNKRSRSSAGFGLTFLKPTWLLDGVFGCVCLPKPPLLHTGANKPRRIYGRDRHTRQALGEKNEFCISQGTACEICPLRLRASALSSTSYAAFYCTSSRNPELIGCTRSTRVVCQRLEIAKSDCIYE